MSKPIKTHVYDAAAHLDDEEAIAAFLEDAIASGSAEVFQEALSIAARAKGIATVAKAAGLNRESLYRAMRPDAAPRFDTVQRVLAALGVRIRLEAV